jgi:RNA polymerase sigma-70 factor (ECF subfamily)
MVQSRGNTTYLQALLDQAAPGNDAYQELIAHAWQRLLRLTRKMLRNYPALRRWEQTEDVFQTAAMKLYRSLTEVKPATVTDFIGLAATQIRRTLIDLGRHHFGPEGQVAHWHSDPNLQAVARSQDSTRPETLEAWTAFHEAAEKLPVEERTVFELVWYAGLPQSEAAQILGISVPTVQRRWYAAQVSLCQALQGETPAAEGE